MTNKYILATSGNDIFSGGGLYADLATHTANHLYGFLVVTCLTALTENGFDVFATSGTIFSHQLSSLKDVPFSGIKLGLLPNVKVANLALEFVKSHVGIPIVLDPVLACKEKHNVEVSALCDELLKSFPCATIITPNLVEAELLAQVLIKALDDMKAVTKKSHQLGAKNLVVKGGNRLSKEKAIDVFYDGENVTVFKTPVLESNNIGAGCTFASSIASQLALGKSAKATVEQSKELVYQVIRHSDQYGVERNYEEN